MTASGALAADRTWTGRSIFPSNNLWSHTGNWDLFFRPANGDRPLFTDHGSRADSFVDYAVTLSGLAFADVDPFLPMLSYTINGSSTLTLAGQLGNQSSLHQRVNAPIRVNAGAQFRNDYTPSGRLTIGGPVNTNGNTLTVFAGGALIDILGPISGTGSLDKRGSGVLELRASNSFSGDTTITSGTLRLMGSGRLADATDLTVSSGAIFEIINISDAINALWGSGHLRLFDGSQLVVGVNGTATGTGDFGGTSEGTGGITKRGTGIFYLSGPNNYSDTIVEQGEIRLRPGGRLGDFSSLNVFSGAIFELGDSTPLNELIGAGRVVFRPATTLTLRYGAFSGRIEGPGNLTKIGDPLHILTLSGVNTYTGNTSVQSGILRLTGTGRLSDLTNVTVSADATLELAGVSDQINNLSGAGTINLLTTARLIVGGTGAVSGRILGAGGITKTGPGTLTLSIPAGNNSNYTGATVVEAGTLAVTALGISPTSPVIVNGGLYLMNGTNQIHSPPSITVGDLGAVRLAPNTFLRTSNVTTSGNGIIDLVDNDMVLTAANLEAITTLIASARNGGATGLWSGPGITSSTAAASGQSLGAILNDNGSGQPLYSSFHGITGLSASSIIVADTVTGDLNLDGIVSISDFIDLASHFGQTSATWRLGDINYDRQVSISDFIDLAANFGATYSSSAALSQPQPQAVPEPAMMVTGALAIGCACLRRRPGARPESAAF